MLASRSTGGIVDVRVSTVGSGYSAPPTVTVSGGGGSGAEVVAYMAGTRIRDLVVVNAGTGYTSDPVLTIPGNAEATAHAYTGPARPMRFLRSRQGLLVGVDGMGRGIHWNGKDSSASPTGLLPPQYAPTITAGTTTSKFVEAIEVFDAGSGYSSPPVVSITGGSPSVPAKARAAVRNGRVVGIKMVDNGRGYQSSPEVSLTGGNASGATFTVNVLGYLASVDVVDPGSGYTTTPTVTIATSNGLTDAHAYAVTADGQVTRVIISAAGTGATATPGLTIAGNAAIKPHARFSVSSVTVGNGGSGFQADANLTFTPDPLDVSVSDAAATAAAVGGVLQSVTVISGGSYRVPPTASVSGLDAEVAARLSSNALTGKYACAIRYLSEGARGAKTPSSISDMTFVEVDSGAGSLEWTLTHGHIDDRVTEVELWRSTGDQETLLYRVATIPRSSFPGTYLDGLADKDLIDVSRDGYGLLPVTLPSGQVNARRFGVLPGNYGVGVMFQDRAWYAVDSTGNNANSLWFSEVDEPESVPSVNELVVQESVGDSDEIVTLLPLASSLLVIQRRHIYKLQYVAQPVIDASMILAGYRGILNQSCVDILGGVAFIADSHGLYAFDNGNLSPVSVAVDDYWREGKIDFTKADKFFVSCDDTDMTVRFFFCDSTSTEPNQSLCYSVATKAWWLEQYGFGLRCTGNRLQGNVHKTVYGTEGGGVATPGGWTDAGVPVSYSLKTPNYPFTDDGSRSVGVLYTPTASTADLRLKLHYNGSETPRQNAVGTDRGGAFVSDKDGALLDMRVDKSHLGDSVGFAKARYAGRGDERSDGSDRHIAVHLSGSQTTEGDSPTIHSVTIEGAG